MSIIAVGCSHSISPLAVIEALSIPPGEVAALLARPKSVTIRMSSSLLESCHAVAERVVIAALQPDGVRHILCVPIGFVSDHLEILYDIDYEAKGKADALGLTFRHIEMPNADPEFIRVLASLVSETPTDSRASLEHVC